MNLYGLSTGVEHGGAVLWVAALIVKREASVAMRFTTSALSLILLLAVPLAVGVEADRLPFDAVMHVLILCVFNASLAMTWALAAGVPKRDLAALAILCTASAGMVVALLLRAMTPPRMF